MFLSVSCKSVEENLETNEVNLRELWRSNLDKLDNSDEEFVSFTEALEILLESNIDLTTSEMDLFRAENDLKFVYRDLIPKLTLKGGYSEFISGSASVFANGWTYGIDSFFNFAYLQQIPSRLYTSRLSLVRANTSKTLKTRKAVIELYKIFREQEMLEKSIEFSLWKDSFKKRLPVEDLAAILFYKDNSSEKVFEEKGRKLQLRLNDHLSDSSKIWRIRPTQLIKLPYVDQGGLNLELIEHIAQDQIKLMAIELEGARLRSRQIDLQYWPDLNLSVSTPSLFRFSGQSKSLWNTDNIRVGADLIWQLDTRGKIKRQKQEFIREREVQDKVLEKKIVSWLLQLSQVNEQLNTVRTQLKKQQVRWQILNSLSVPTTMSVFQERMQLFEKWWMTSQVLEKEIVELETALWFFDDTQWQILGEIDRN